MRGGEAWKVAQSTFCHKEVDNRLEQQTALGGAQISSTEIDTVSLPPAFARTVPA